MMVMAVVLWTNLVDSGGLVHVNEITYALFISLENEIRDCLKSLWYAFGLPSHHIHIR